MRKTIKGAARWRLGTVIKDFGERIHFPGVAILGERIRRAGVRR